VKVPGGWDPFCFPFHLFIVSHVVGQIAQVLSDHRVKVILLPDQTKLCL
jgi:hypothetical protein